MPGLWFEHPDTLFLSVWISRVFRREFPSAIRGGKPLLMSPSRFPLASHFFDSTNAGVDRPFCGLSRLGRLAAECERNETLKREPVLQPRPPTHRRDVRLYYVRIARDKIWLLM